MMSDPIADLLTRIRNASRAEHEKVDIPSSKLKVRITELATSSDERDAWLSPDGHRLYFSSNRSGNFDLYVASR